MNDLFDSGCVVGFETQWPSSVVPDCNLCLNERQTIQEIQEITDMSLRIVNRSLFIVLAIFFASSMTAAQNTQPTPAQPAANPADVGSMDSIVAAVYDVISGPAGKKRDWDRMRSLFIQGARLIPTGPRPNDGYASRVLTVEDFISRSAPFLEKEGFFEKESARKTETFANIAHVFSTYESRHTAQDPKPFQRGINSFQLMNDGSRWWIVTIFWQGEDEKNPIPEKYLK